MAFKSYFLKVGRLRFYSRASDGPYFLEVPFRGVVTGPVDRPRPPETMVHDRGRFIDTSHYVMGPDTPITDPLPFSCNFRLANTEPNFSKFLTMIRGAGNTGTARATKTIGTRVWTSTKASTTLRNAEVAGAGTALHTTPDFLDTEKWCMNAEILWEDPDNSNDRGFRWSALYLPPERQVPEGETDVMVDLSGEVYGAIALITTFTAGTES